MIPDKPKPSAAYEDSIAEASSSCMDLEVKGI